MNPFNRDKPDFELPDFSASYRKGNPKEGASPFLSQMAAPQTTEETRPLSIQQQYLQNEQDRTEVPPYDGKGGGYQRPNPGFQQNVGGQMATVTQQNGPIQGFSYRPDSGGPYQQRGPPSNQQYQGNGGGYGGGGAGGGSGGYQGQAQPWQQNQSHGGGGYQGNQYQQRPQQYGVYGGPNQGSGGPPSQPPYRNGGPNGYCGPRGQGGQGGYGNSSGPGSGGGNYGQPNNFNNQRFGNQNSQPNQPSSERRPSFQSQQQQQPGAPNSSDGFKQQTMNQFTTPKKNEAVDYSKYPIVVYKKALMKKHRRKNLDYLLNDFKRSLNFSMFACRYEQEQTLSEEQNEEDREKGRYQHLEDLRPKRHLAEQFGRGTFQFYNCSTQKSEIQLYFWSDQQLFWPKIFIRPHQLDPFWISIDVTKRPFLHSKTNMKALLIASCYFVHTQVFIPIFFALLEDVQTPESYLAAMTKLKSEIIEQYAVVPTQILASPEPALIAAVQEVFKPKRNFPQYPRWCLISHCNFVRKTKKLLKHFGFDKDKLRPLGKKLLVNLKKLQFDRPGTLQPRWERLTNEINQEAQSIDDFPEAQLADFLRDFTRIFLFQDTPCPPGSLSVSQWSLGDLVRKDEELVLKLSTASEFIQATITHYFPPALCHDKEQLDIRTVVDRLKQIEKDFSAFFDLTSPSDPECKSGFMPYGAFQISKYLEVTKAAGGDGSQQDAVKEFDREQLDILSEDDLQECEATLESRSELDQLYDLQKVFALGKSDIERFVKNPPRAIPEKQDEPSPKPAQQKPQGYGIIENDPAQSAQPGQGEPQLPQYPQQQQYSQPLPQSQGYNSQQLPSSGQPYYQQQLQNGPPNQGYGHPGGPSQGQNGGGPHGPRKIDLSQQTFGGGGEGRKQPSYSFIGWLCNRVKCEDDLFSILKENQVHDDNVHCINWDDLKDMGVPIACAKQFTWIVRRTRQKQGAYDKDNEGGGGENNSYQRGEGRGRGRGRGGRDFGRGKEDDRELTWDELKKQSSGAGQQPFQRPTGPVPMRSNQGGIINDAQINALGRRGPPPGSQGPRKNYFKLDDIGQELMEKNEDGGIGPPPEAPGVVNDAKSDHSGMSESTID